MSRQPPGWRFCYRDRRLGTMPHEVGLRTSHPVVQALVSRWIADARLAIPEPVTLAIDVGPLTELRCDPRVVFRHSRVDVHRGPGDQTLTLNWEPGFGRAVIEPHSTTALVTVTEQGLAHTNELLRAFLLTVCILLVRRVGLHHVHGATLRDPHDRGWLIAGTSGSGKSTTTALLATRGWRAGTDDIAFFTAGHSPDRTDLVAWRERLALLDDAVLATRHTGGTPLAARGKTGWFVEQLGAEWISRVTPAVLVFPRVNATAPTAATPLRATAALTRLMQSSAWVALEAAVADEHLRLMSQLVVQARAYEVSLGRDMFERPELLLELVA